MLFDEILIALSKRDDFFHFIVFCGEGMRRSIESYFLRIYEISNDMVLISSGELNCYGHTLDEVLKVYDESRKFINGFNIKGENQNEKW